MLNNLLEAIKFVNSGGVIDDHYSVGIQIGINTGDRKIAQTIINDLKVPMNIKMKA